MPFAPAPQDEIVIDETSYRVAEHPAAPGMPYGQEGRQAVVYKLNAKEGDKALKVFKPRFSSPALVSLAERIESYARLPGMEVAKRVVLTPLKHKSLLRQHPDLQLGEVRRGL